MKQITIVQWTVAGESSAAEGNDPIRTRTNGLRRDDDIAAGPVRPPTLSRITELDEQAQPHKLLQLPLALCQGKTHHRQTEILQETLIQGSLLVTWDSWERRPAATNLVSASASLLLRRFGDACPE